jgi:hypothetical protein
LKSNFSAESKLDTLPFSWISGKIATFGPMIFFSKRRTYCENDVRQPKMPRSAMDRIYRKERQNAILQINLAAGGVKSERCQRVTKQKQNIHHRDRKLHLIT